MEPLKSAIILYVLHVLTCITTSIFTKTSRNISIYDGSTRKLDRAWPNMAPAVAIHTLMVDTTVLVDQI